MKIPISGSLPRRRRKSPDYRITKEFHFSASHQLAHLPDDHQCARMHGHNYVVEVELAAPNLNADGFVPDYGELKPLKTYIDETFDHHHLNDVMNILTTTENMARHFYGWGAFSACIEAAQDGPKVVMKIVIFDDTNYAWARAVADRYPALPLYLQPGNAEVGPDLPVDPQTLSDRLLWLVEKVTADGWFTPRVLPQPRHISRGLHRVHRPPPG